MDSKGPGKVNILIVKLSAIGDVVHTLPALATLRELYPEADITWVVEESSSDIIKNHPYLNRVIVSRRKQWVADLKNSIMQAKRLPKSGHLLRQSER